MSNHQFVHVEISARDREVAGKFYHDLFGWEVQQMPDVNYATFSTGDGGVGGGFNPVNEENPAGTIMVYINTDDIKTSLKDVERLGGKALMQPMDIPEVGQFAIFQDPTGNKLALLQPLPM